MRLIIIVATVISCSVLISLVFFQATRKTYPGVDRWTAGVIYAEFTFGAVSGLSRAHYMPPGFVCPSVRTRFLAFQ